MTENKNEQDIEPGRPSWAAGLLLSPDMIRAGDRRLELTAQMRASSHPILRRLADAEMRIAELERQLAREKGRGDALTTYLDRVTGFDMRVALDGHPDFLIESDGSEWKRVDGQGRYARTDGSFPGFTPDRAKIERSADGPVRAVWKEVGVPERGEPDFLIDKDGGLWRLQLREQFTPLPHEAIYSSPGGSGGWGRSVIDGTFGPITEAWK